MKTSIYSFRLRGLASIICILIPGIFLAQPTITEAWLGQPGDMISSASAEMIPDVSPSGENALWDFSGVTTRDTLILSQQFVDPDTTAFFSVFPNSNICMFLSLSDAETGELRVYNYSRSDNDVWELTGSVITASELDTIKVTYDDPESILTFPFTYESSGFDFFSGTRDLGVFAGEKIVTGTFSGDVLFDGESYGSVMLPGGTFDDCLRLRSKKVQTDITDFGAGNMQYVHTTSTSYFWLTLAHPGPIASYEVSETFSVLMFPPLPPDTTEVSFDTSFTWDPSAVSSGTKFYRPEAYDLGVAPNPFNQSMTLTFVLKKSEDITLELRSLTGQIVFVQEVSGVAGENTLRMQPGDIPSGSYFIVLSGADRGVVKKIIKVE